MLAHNLASKLYIVDYNHIFLVVVDSARLFWGHARQTGEDSEPGTGLAQILRVLNSITHTT